MIFSKLLPTLKRPPAAAGKLPKRFDGRLSLKNRTIKKEAYLGGRLFGDLGAGRSREFFCLDANNWVWHETWVDPRTGRRYANTLRYEIRGGLVYKKQNDDADWRVLGGGEADNFRRATDAYRRGVLAKLYPDRDWRRP
ncbi:hypothetical protein F4X86_00665 [Candidatus Saccharibacteria bacterium]|nr:hypothetical protein [Candidatus Saccharibacteria bacterium]